MDNLEITDKELFTYILLFYKKSIYHVDSNKLVDWNLLGWKPPFWFLIFMFSKKFLTRWVHCGKPNSNSGLSVVLKKSFTY